MITPERAAKRLLADRWLTDLLEALSGDGHEARLIGGAVRDALLEDAVSDIDLAVTRHPENVLALAKAHDWQAIPTGLAHGTVTLVTAGRKVEVTTLREDIATDGRHAIVRFGRDFERDAARRDFTINAFSLSRNGELHDYFDGLADLAAGRVRFIGEAEQRLREDFLRALRFLRFSARYADGRLDPAGFAAVLNQRSGLATLSGERIGQEIFKLLASAHGARVIEAAEWPHGLLGQLLGGPLAPASLTQCLAFTAAVAAPPLSPLARLAILAVRMPGDIARLRQALKLSNREVEGLRQLLAAWMALSAGADPRLIAYRYPEAALEAASWQTSALWTDGRSERARTRFEAIRAAMAHGDRFELSGADLLARGLPAGPKIGMLLAKSEEAWIEAGFPAGRAAQLTLLEQVLAR